MKLLQRARDLFWILVCLMALVSLYSKVREQMDYHYQQKYIQQ